MFSLEKIRHWKEVTMTFQLLQGVFKRQGERETGILVRAICNRSKVDGFKHKYTR